MQIVLYLPLMRCVHTKTIATIWFYRKGANLGVRGYDDAKLIQRWRCFNTRALKLQSYPQEGGRVFSPHHRIYHTSYNVWAGPVFSLRGLYIAISKPV